MPVPGEVDVVIASELMEAGRAITRGLVTPDRTTLIASTNRVYSMTEKIAMGDGRADADAFLKASAEAARIFIHRDFAAMAEENRSVISATLFGALAGAGSLPFSRKQFESAIERSGVSVTSSLKAFAAGFDAATSSERDCRSGRQRSPKARSGACESRCTDNFRFSRAKPRDSSRRDRTAGGLSGRCLRLNLS